MASVLPLRDLSLLRGNCLNINLGAMVPRSLVLPFDNAGGERWSRDRLKSAGVRVEGPVAGHRGKVVNPRAGSRWLFAFAALSELPLEPGK